MGCHESCGGGRRLISIDAYLDSLFKRFDLSVHHFHSSAAGLVIATATPAATAFAASTTHAGVTEQWRRADKSEVKTRRRLTLFLRVLYFWRVLNSIVHSSRRAMGGLPDASRVGGTWFSDTNPTEWCLPDDLASQVITPALVVDLAKVRRNVLAIKNLLNGDLNKWRPHLKTTKMPVVWLELVRLGVTNFKVATTKEASVLAQTLEQYVEQNLNLKNTSEKKNETPEKKYVRRGGKKQKTSDKTSDTPDKRSTPPTQKTANGMLADLLKKRLVKQGLGFDILVAYPVTGPARHRVSALAKAFPWIKWSVLIEHEEVFEGEGKNQQLTRYYDDGVGYFVDVNPGMHRTGAEASSGYGNVNDDDARTRQILKACINQWEAPNAHKNRKFLNPRPAFIGFRGVHFYEGHVSSCISHTGASVLDIEDNRSKRDDACKLLYQKTLVPLLLYLKQKGSPPIELITSGTPGFTHALNLDVVSEIAKLEMVPIGVNEKSPWIKHHRVSPGTVVFHDWRGERQNPGIGLAPAAVLMSRVVSLPSKNRCTLDCGSKALAAEVGDPAGYVLGHPTWRALQCSEEHLPIAIGEEITFSSGGRDDVGLFSEVNHSRYERPSLSECAVPHGPEASGADAGSIYIGGDNIRNALNEVNRRRPWDVALAKRRESITPSRVLVKEGGIDTNRAGGDIREGQPSLKDDRPRRGDVVFVVPEHICPTVNLALQAVVVDNGKLVGVLDVDARGHEIVPPEIPPALTTHALLKAVEASK